MAYQFLHLEAYGRTGAHRRKSSKRKHCMTDILNEMVRVKQACPHVKQLKKPQVLLGSAPEDVFAKAAKHADVAVDKIGRKLRCDAPVVVVGVTSWPELVAEIKADAEKRAKYASWRARTLEWLQVRWGDHLKSVVEHLDEPRPHLHFVVVPKLDGAGRLCIDQVHPGHRAATDCKSAGGSPRQQKDAYAAAMIALQDDCYDSVSARCGLVRLGPRRQRLTRKQWVDQQCQAAALAAFASNTKRRAREFVIRHADAVKAEAQSKIDAVLNRSSERIAELNEQVAAQAEEVQRLRALLEEHGIISPGMTL